MDHTQLGLALTTVAASMAWVTARHRASRAQRRDTVLSAALTILLAFAAIVAFAV